MSAATTTTGATMQTTIIAQETILTIDGTEQPIKPAKLEAAIEFFQGLYETEAFTVETRIAFDTPMSLEEQSKLEDEA